MGSLGRDPEKNRARYRRYYQRHREAILQRLTTRKTTWTPERRERELARMRAYRLVLKIEAYEAYGGARCACCGEDTEEFLSIDHVHRNGAAMRRDSKREAAALYKHLKDQGYPPGYQVLCMNCNFGRERNGGICPHRSTRSE